MNAEECRIQILQILYNHRAQGSLQPLDRDNLTQRLRRPWDQIRHEVNYLEEKGYISSKSRQIGTRIFYTYDLKAEGIDLVEGRTTGEPTPAPTAGSVPLSSQKVFISYAWGGESEQIVDQLDQAFQAKGITIVRDKRDLGFKGQIKEFMKEIGRGKAVVVVISEKYLKSENCMFELVQIAKNGQFYDRIFPIVLADAQIYKPVQRIKYIQHWEQQIKNLDKAMKTVSAANLQGFRDEIDQYTEIRNAMAELVYTLKNMNTLTPEMHSESGFEELFKAVERKLAE